MKSADTKRIKIIESAKRRFSHFGMAKTTMAEIAKDLSFSKALLYYYFPDKNSLYLAVLDYVTEELLTNTEETLDKGGSIEKMMMEILEKRISYVKEYYHIFEHMHSLRMDLPSELQKSLPAFFEKELQMMVKLFDKGVENGEIKVEDKYVTAKIFMVSLLGMRLVATKEFKGVFVPPSKEEFDDILAMQKKFAKIFINGLRVG